MKVAPVVAYLARYMPNLRVATQIPNDPQPLGIDFVKNLRQPRTVHLRQCTAGTLMRHEQRWGLPD